jgi:hypothetical protein
MFRPAGGVSEFGANQCQTLWGFVIQTARAWLVSLFTPSSAKAGCLQRAPTSSPRRLRRASSCAPW